MSYEVELVELPEQSAAAVHGHVEHNGIGPFLGQAFGEVMGAAEHQHLQVTGAPFGRYRQAGPGAWDVEAGFPVSAPPSPEGRVEPLVLPGGSVARTLHVGDYGGVGAAYEAAAAWITEHGFAPSGDPWECYLDGPEVANPRTEVFFPCRKASAG
ncbi:GyrI-like domain-containing protein [Paenarthrobacter sp. DKR-5]|uniref:GyrI-like domain-containing protein n=1 Tax=Paenarthrobacter sp. DKR-5 TaxID=2835535 RepID=UPI001BDD3F18|nr:GyrI-like domain-containing protein [Paenarthrobacter sp. DKR-5]MBT1001331.1 GyrI-like domain-containing protein [Paenarthrobacter sp. DKR-5]